MEVKLSTLNRYLQVVDQKLDELETAFLDFCKEKPAALDEE